MSVSELLKRRELSRWCVHDVRSVVEKDRKERFLLRENSLNGELQIKACQGHTKPVSFCLTS